MSCLITNLDKYVPVVCVFSSVFLFPFLLVKLFSWYILLYIVTTICGEKGYQYGEIARRSIILKIFNLIP